MTSIYNKRVKTQRVPLAACPPVLSSHGGLYLSSHWKRAASGTLILLLVFIAMLLPSPASAASLQTVIERVQPKIVKIYGAGGFRGLEAYQSGVLISSEGHILTVWSYVLDTDYITAVLDDGRRFDAKLLAADPRLEIAVLKIDAHELPYFRVEETAEAAAGTRVLAFSNMFGVATGNEPASVLHGVVSVLSKLQARRGAYETPYDGPAYILDAMTNNPGAAGGALVDYQGRLLGVLGKELRNSLNNTWLNYAVPLSEMKTTVEQILEGSFTKRPLEDTAARPEFHYEPELIGLVMVPDVLERTPPYIDQVRLGTPAASAGLQADDLVLFVNDRLVQSCKQLVKELEYIDQADPIRLTVMRNKELVDVQLQAPQGEAAP